MTKDTAADVTEQGVDKVPPVAMVTDDIDGKPMSEPLSDSELEDELDMGGDDVTKPGNGVRTGPPSMLDLCFVMDCTGSMGSYIDNAREVGTSTAGIMTSRELL